MSVFYADQIDEFWIPDDECWFCARPMLPVSGHLPAVVWMGSTGTIGLHRDCAERLGVNLIKDAREAELAVTPGWQHRAARVVREQLTAAEARP